MGIRVHIGMMRRSGLLASGFSDESSDESSKEHSTCPHCGKEI